MSDHSSTPLFQARAAMADEAVRMALGELIDGWADHDVAASGGDTFDQRLVIHPALAGAIIGLATLAWDSAPHGATLDNVFDAFAYAIKTALAENALDRPAGLLDRMHRHG